MMETVVRVPPCLSFAFTQEFVGLSQRGLLLRFVFFLRLLECRPRSRICILYVCVYRISNALLGVVAEPPLYHGAVYRLRFENMSRFSAFQNGAYLTVFSTLHLVLASYLEARRGYLLCVFIRWSHNTSQSRALPIDRPLVRRPLQNWRV